MLGQLTRFAGVGLFATLTHVTVAFAIRYGLGWDVQAANLAGFIVAVMLSYFGHAQVTFRSTGNHQWQMPRFGLVAGFGLLLSSGITFVICDLLGGSFALAMAIVAMAVPGSTFLGSRFWVFARRDEQATQVDWTGAMLAVGFAGLFYFIFKDRYINHDTAWYLVATRKWLEGANLYSDLVEVNPPLNFYLTVPALYLSDLFNSTETNGQYLFLSVLMAISLTWAWHLLERSGELDQKRRFLMLTAVAAAMVIPAIGCAGQREHLMVILIMPYFLGYLLFQGAGKGKAGMARATFAAVGICIKPHFLLIPIALTVAEMMRSRSFRPVLSAANLTLCAMGGTYVALVILLHPEYFGSIVPMAVLVYGDYGYDSATVIRNMTPVVPAFFLLAAVAATATGLGRLTLVPLAAVLAGCGIYFVQWTGYTYQALPIHAFAIVGFIWLLLHTRFTSTPALIAAVGLVFSGVTAAQSGFYRSSATDVFAPIMKAEFARPRVMVFSSSLWPSFPLVLETGATWTSRYPALWLIPGTVNGLATIDCVESSDICAKMLEIQRRTRTHIIDDLEIQKPNILFFEHKPSYFDKPFNYQNFLNGDLRFSELIHRYQLLQSGKRFSIWVAKPD